MGKEVEADGSPRKKGRVVGDETVAETEIFGDRLGRLLREAGVTETPEESSCLVQFLEQLHLEETLRTPSAARAPGPEEKITAAERSRRRRATAQAKIAEEQQYLCSRMAAQSEPWICARAVVRVEAAKAVNSAAKLGVELSAPELHLFDEICRSALKSLKEQASVARSETYNSEDPVVRLLNEIVELIENCLLPLCPVEDCVVYNCLKGDILTFFEDTLHSSEHNNKAVSAYEEAFECAAKTCDALHPNSIRVAVSLATCLDKSDYSLRGYNINQSN